MSLQFGFDLAADGFIEIQHVFPINAAQFEMGYFILNAGFNLLIKLGRNFIGKSR